MVWAAPRTWIDQEVVTVGNFNAHIRDNFLALDQHGHSGAAGDGGRSLGNLVLATFTDAAAPAAPGAGLTVLYSVSGRPFYRAGGSGASTQLADANDLHAQTHAASHEPSGADTMAVNAAAGTGSLRTLGSTATTAAAGNHTHPLASPNVVEVNTQIGGDTSSEVVVCTTTFTPQEAGLSVALVGTLFQLDGAGNTYTARLKHGTTVVDSVVGITPDDNGLHVMQGLQTTAPESSTVYTVTIQRTAGGSAWGNTVATLVAREITKNT